MGLRRRVSVGFVSIVSVLILSGLVSFYELNVLSNETEDILGTNRKYRDVTAHLTLALRDQNRAFIHITAYGDRSYDSLCVASSNRLEAALVEARRERVVPDIVDTLENIASRLRNVTQTFINTPRYDPKYDVLFEEFPQLDTISTIFAKREFVKYQALYDKMMSGIDHYYIDSQSTLAPGTEQLHSNAYRAVTPVLISLIVMIAIVMMLYYFMMLYCVTPVVKMNKSVKDYIAYKVPFAPKGERHDEMQELCEGIESLIKQSKITKE
ncbi:MAG: hypothetical protein SNF68_04720 [Rikenellaceae bacterium]